MAGAVLGVLVVITAVSGMVTMAAASATSRASFIRCRGRR
jgi:hypothetical protein